MFGNDGQNTGWLSKIHGPALIHWLTKTAVRSFGGTVNCDTVKQECQDQVFSRNVWNEECCTAPRQNGQFKCEGCVKL